MDTIHLNRESYMIKGSYRYLVDKNYTHEEALALIDSDTHKSYNDKGRLFRSYDAYWVAIVVVNDSKTNLSVNAEAKFDGVWIDGLPQPCCKGIPCKDPRGIIKQAQLNSSYFDLTPGVHFFIARISYFHLGKNFAPTFSDSNSFEGNILQEESRNIILLILLMGVFLILGLISLFIFLKLKDWSLLWYAFFCWNLLLHFTRNLGERYESFDIVDKYLDWTYAKFFIFLLFYVCYVFFCLNLIDAKNKYADEYRRNKIALYCFMAMAIPELFLLLIGSLEISYTYYFSVRFCANVFFIYLLSRMIKYRNDVFVKFVLIGGYSLLLADLITSLFISNFTYAIAIAGTIIDVLVFSTALSYKIFDNNRKRMEAQSEHMQSQNKILELNLDKAKLNMVLLQSQINPHFIFNSLNSIKYHIINHENDKASYYLSQFSKLVRLVLDQSSKQTIPLAKEIEVLQLYLEMEALRFDNSFAYKINVDNIVEVDMIEVPPHIIQPYVENAIVHAFTGKKINCLLTIEISEDDRNLIIVIEDNGIGRILSKQLNQNKLGDIHESKGHRITMERVAQFGIIKGIKTGIKIFDLVDIDGRGIGTKVVIRL